MSRNTAILSNDRGMIALDSPVKLKILELLENGYTSFDELVEKSRKAKSTISVHLHDLQNMDLIHEKTHPNDKRKKYFVLNAIYLAYSEPPIRQQYDRQMDLIASSLFDGDSFKEKLFCSLRYVMEAHGIDPKPILKKLGNDIGLRIGREFKSKDSQGILNEISGFWKQHGLGDMTIRNGNGIEISVVNCYHCGKMPDVGKTLCSMDEGFIEGVFFSKLKYACRVSEIECYGAGDNNCKFIIEEK
ncbi:MAG: ArsR family transcriptional regulator [Candidatus Methanoperedens sp.]|nr:ArsR family transcriptional regulator [Candidatus Methanoperedens sp.]